MFEPESSQCDKCLCCCHVLPACSLVVTCPVADDVRCSDWIFSVQRIPDFHAASLVETVTRHRSCVALCTLEMTLCPPDNCSTASAISKCTTELSNRRVTTVDVCSQQLSLLRREMEFLIHFCFRRLVCAIKFFQQSLALWGLQSRMFPVVTRASHRLVACSLSKLHRADGGFSLYHCF